MARVALVTGGMGGLGESICIKLAALGYKVVTTHSPGNQGGRMAADDEQHGLQLGPLRCRRFRLVQGLCRNITCDIGPVDVLVEQRRHHPRHDLQAHDQGRLGCRHHTNLDSVFNMTKRVMDGMVERKWGRVINVSSLNGIRALSVR